MHEPAIRINQLGYRLEDVKTAFLALPPDTAPASVDFEVIVLEGPPGKFPSPIALTGASSAFRPDPATGMAVARIDIGALDIPGLYRIRTKTGLQSPPFRIAANPYAAARDAMRKALYFMRCGCALEPAHASIWTHGACHIAKACLHTDPSVQLDVSGGWHDAGDYGRYVGPGCNAVAELLLAFEFFPEALSGTVNIPESGNGVPDLLNECRYELEFLLKMQDSASGGLYHKVATLQFPGYIMPEDDGEPLFINHISATATGGFAACLAAAAVAFRPYDAAFADRMLSAARKAWAWLEANPSVPGFRNPPDVHSGEYGDETDTDERFWAAVELYAATGEEAFHQAAIRLGTMPELDRTSLGWADIGGMGTIRYLLLPEAKRDPALSQCLEAVFFAEADRLAAVAATDGFGTTLRPEDYIWGSAMLLMNQAVHLIAADRFRPGNGYRQAAAQNLHSLFGANAMGLSLVTGVGTYPVLNPHYRPSVADGIAHAVPGLVSGGPNAGRQDPPSQHGIPDGTAPALCLIDDIESYATNEVTIYWNAPAVFVAAAFSC